MNRNKYKAVRTPYNGVTYDSKAEAEYAAQLDMEMASRQKYVSWWVRQVTFALGCPENAYRVDFLVMTPGYDRVGGNFHIHAVDVKGCETPKFKKDKKLWAKYGPCPLKIVKSVSGKLSTVEVIRP